MSFGAISKRALLGEGQGKTAYERYREGKEPRIDENLPFDLRVGGMIELDIPLSSWVLVRGDIAMKKPAKRGKIFAIGKIDLGSDLHIIRVYYSKSVEENSDIAGISFLQIEMEADKVLETKIFTLDNEFDLTDDDSEVVFDNGDGTLTASIPLWINSDEPILGAPEFYIPNEDEEKDEWVYTRDSKPNLMEQIIDEREEILYDSTFKRSAVSMKLTAAEYSRAFENESAFGGREFCIVRLTETKDDASIEVYLGISIESSKIMAL